MSRLPPLLLAAGLFLVGCSHPAHHGSRAASGTPPRSTRPRCTERNVFSWRPRRPWNPPLPPSEPFLDPAPPKRSLTSLRRRASRRVGPNRLRDMAQLAAALWKRGRQSVEQAGQSGRDVALRRAHAAFREAVALLKQVLREAPRFRLARLRLAYYLRVLDPEAAVDEFERLLQEAAPREAALHRDYARVLLSLGRAAAALQVLEGAPETPPICYLRFLAAWKVRGTEQAAAWLPCGLRAAPIPADRLLARVLAAASRPDRLASAWKGHVPETLLRPAARSALALLARWGRMGAAEALAASLGLPAPTPPGDCLALWRQRAAWCLVPGLRRAAVRVHPDGRCLSTPGDTARCFCRACRPKSPCVLEVVFERKARVPTSR